MKIMTFNIQHALDYQKRIIDQALFANAILESGADICGLNEVRNAGPIEGYTDQAREIGEPIGFYHYFGEAIRINGTSPYGNGILSRAPFTSVETIPIPDPADRSEGKHYETRCVIRSIVSLDGADVCILVCHMGLNLSERINAVDTICKLIDDCDLPLILMGDFNATPESPELKPLFDRLQDSTRLDPTPNANTFPSDAPKIKIDYLLYKKLRCVKAETINRIYSDHLPILAEFEHIQ